MEMLPITDLRNTVQKQTTWNMFPRVVLKAPATNCHTVRSSEVVPSCGQSFDKNTGALDNKHQQISVQEPT